MESEYIKYYRFLNNSSLSVQARYIYSVIIHHDIYRSGNIEITQSKLAELSLFKSLKTIRKYITELVDNSIIKVVKRGANRPNLIKIVDTNYKTILSTNSFVQIPVELTTDPLYSTKLNIKQLLLFSFMHDRNKLSLNNTSSYSDDHGVFVSFQRKTIMEQIGMYARNTFYKAVALLKNSCLLKNIKAATGRVRYYINKVFTFATSSRCEYVNIYNNIYDHYNRTKSKNDILEMHRVCNRLKARWNKKDAEELTCTIWLFLAMIDIDEYWDYNRARWAANLMVKLNKKLTHNELYELYHQK